MTDASRDVPRRLTDALVRQPLIEMSTARALVRFPGLGRWLVDSDGADIRQPDPGRHESDFEFLTDTVIALRELLARRIALRAAVVSVGGRGVAICGTGPAGKSSLAAALVARGHRVVSDAVATVQLANGVPMASPQSGGLLLWPDIVRHLGLEEEAGQFVRAGLRVRRFEFPTVTTSVPLAMVICLHDSPDEPNQIERLVGFNAVDRLLWQRWHRFAMAPLQLEPASFLWATQLATAVTMCTLTTSRLTVDLDEAADAVLAALEGTAQ